MFYGVSPFGQVPFASTASNVYSLLITENLGSADSISIAANFASSVTENLGSADSSTQASALLQTITEVLTSNDTNAEIDVFYFGVVEGITQVDTNQVGVGVTIKENIGVADTPTGGFISFYTITENINANTNLPTQSTFNVSVTEATTLLDSEVFHAQFKLAITEILRIADFQGESYWIKINDSQSVTWTQINDSQSVTWTKINNTQ